MTLGLGVGLLRLLQTLVLTPGVGVGVTIHVYPPALLVSPSKAGPQLAIAGAQDPVQPRHHAGAVTL